MEKAHAFRVAERDRELVKEARERHLKEKQDRARKAAEEADKRRFAELEQQLAERRAANIKVSWPACAHACALVWVCCLVPASPSTLAHACIRVCRPGSAPVSNAPACRRHTCVSVQLREEARTKELSMRRERERRIMEEAQAMRQEERQSLLKAELAEAELVRRQQELQGMQLSMDDRRQHNMSLRGY